MRLADGHEARDEKNFRPQPLRRVRNQLPNL